MKKVNILLILVFFVIIKQETYAQRQEIRKWRAILYTVKPLDLRDLTLQLDSLHDKNKKLKQDILALKKGSQNFESKLKQKENEIANLLNANLKLKHGNITPSHDEYREGITYKIQIGAFRNYDLSKFHGKGNFWTEEENGMKKYSIANFREYDEAVLFKEYLQTMGAKDAWIVTFINGIRCINRK